MSEKRTSTGRRRFSDAQLVALSAMESARSNDDKWAGSVLRGLKSILHDGDADDAPSDKYPEIEGHWYMTVQTTTKYPPKVVGREGTDWEKDLKRSTLLRTFKAI